jgi:hypothetical protein
VYSSASLESSSDEELSSDELEDSPEESESEEQESSDVESIARRLMFISEWVPESEESYSELLSSSESSELDEEEDSCLRVCQRLILDYFIPFFAFRVYITAVLASFLELRSEFTAAVNSSRFSVLVQQLQDEAINY